MIETRRFTQPRQGPHSDHVPSDMMAYKRPGESFFRQCRVSDWPSIREALLNNLMVGTK